MSGWDTSGPQRTYGTGAGLGVNPSNMHPSRAASLSSYGGGGGGGASTPPNPTGRGPLPDQSSQFMTANPNGGGMMGGSAYGYSSSSFGRGPPPQGPQQGMGMPRPTDNGFPSRAPSIAGANPSQKNSPVPAHATVNAYQGGGSIIAAGGGGGRGDWGGGGGQSYNRSPAPNAINSQVTSPIPPHANVNANQNMSFNGGPRNDWGRGGGSSLPPKPDFASSNGPIDTDRRNEFAPSQAADGAVLDEDWDSLPTRTPAVVVAAPPPAARPQETWDSGRGGVAEGANTSTGTGTNFPPLFAPVPEAKEDDWGAIGDSAGAGGNDPSASSYNTPAPPTRQGGWSSEGGIGSNTTGPPAPTYNAPAPPSRQDGWSSEGGFGINTNGPPAPSYNTPAPASKYDDWSSGGGGKNTAQRPPPPQPNPPGPSNQDHWGSSAPAPVARAPPRATFDHPPPAKRDGWAASGNVGTSNTFTPASSFKPSPANHDDWGAPGTSGVQTQSTASAPPPAEDEGWSSGGQVTAPMSASQHGSGGMRGPGWSSGGEGYSRGPSQVPNQPRFGQATPNPPHGQMTSPPSQQPHGPPPHQEQPPVSSSVAEDDWLTVPPPPARTSTLVQPFTDSTPASTRSPSRGDAERDARSIHDMDGSDVKAVQGREDVSSGKPVANEWSAAPSEARPVSTNDPSGNMVPDHRLQQAIPSDMPPAKSASPEDWGATPSSALPKSSVTDQGDSSCKSQQPTTAPYGSSADQSQPMPDRAGSPTTAGNDIVMSTERIRDLQADGTRQMSGSTIQSVKDDNWFAKPLDRPSVQAGPDGVASQSWDSPPPRGRGQIAAPAPGTQAAAAWSGDVAKELEREKSNQPVAQTNTDDDHGRWVPVKSAEGYQSHVPHQNPPLQSVWNDRNAQGQHARASVQGNIPTQSSGGWNNGPQYPGSMSTPSQEVEKASRDDEIRRNRDVGFSGLSGNGGPAASGMQPVDSGWGGGAQPVKQSTFDFKCFRCKEYGHKEAECKGPREMDPDRMQLPSVRGTLSAHLKSYGEGATRPPRPCHCGRLHYLLEHNDLVCVCGEDTHRPPECPIPIVSDPYRPLPYACYNCRQLPPKDRVHWHRDCPNDNRSRYQSNDGSAYRQSLGFSAPLGPSGSESPMEAGLSRWAPQTSEPSSVSQALQVQAHPSADEKKVDSSADDWESGPPKVSRIRSREDDSFTASSVPTVVPDGGWSQMFAKRSEREEAKADRFADAGAEPSSSIESKTAVEDDNATPRPSMIPDLEPLSVEHANARLNAKEQTPIVQLKQVDLDPAEEVKTEPLIGPRRADLDTLHKASMEGTRNSHLQQVDVNATEEVKTATLASPRPAEIETLQTATMEEPRILPPASLPQLSTQSAALLSMLGQGSKTSSSAVEDQTKEEAPRPDTMRSTSLAGLPEGIEQIIHLNDDSEDETDKQADTQPLERGTQEATPPAGASDIATPALANVSLASVDQAQYPLVPNPQGYLAEAEERALKAEQIARRENEHHQQDMFRLRATLQEMTRQRDSANFQFRQLQSQVGLAELQSIKVTDLHQEISSLSMEVRTLRTENDRLRRSSAKQTYRPPSVSRAVILPPGASITSSLNGDFDRMYNSMAAQTAQLAVERALSAAEVTTSASRASHFRSDAPTFTPTTINPMSTAITASILGPMSQSAQPASNS